MCFVILFQTLEFDHLTICQKCCENINAFFDFYNKSVSSADKYSSYMTSLSAFVKKKNIASVHFEDVIKIGNLDFIEAVSKLPLDLKNSQNDSVLFHRIKIEPEIQNSQDNVYNGHKTQQNNSVGEILGVFIKTEFCSDEKIIEDLSDNMGDTGKLNILSYSY